MSAMLAESRRAEATAVVESPRGERKRVVIIGGGFAGIASVMQNEHPVPGVAQAAIQEGRYVGRLIAKELKEQEVNKRPFRYFDKGTMAVVGKNYAVLERGGLHTGGFLTYLVWAFVHILSLPQLHRLRVQRQWLWSYFTGQRSSRLIPEPPMR